MEWIIIINYLVHQGMGRLDGMRRTSGKIKLLIKMKVNGSNRLKYTMNI